MSASSFQAADCRTTVETALREDIGSGDLTTGAVVSPETRGSGQIVARQAMVACGLPVMAEVFRQVDEQLSFEPQVEDGHVVAEGGEVIARIEGALASILTAERVALNFAQRLSGIATLTREFCLLLPPEHEVRLVDTRKTTPGLRTLEKYAVRVGGGHNHRFGLDDGVMIKDNHIVAAGGITEAVRRARESCHHLMQIEVEVETLQQAREAITAGIRVLLLDNFAVEELATVVTSLRAEAPEVLLEASGGVSLDTVAAIAATGVDVISCGSLTHQARSVDISLDLARQ